MKREIKDNVRIKTFPDGTKQYLFSSAGYDFGALKPRKHDGSSVKRKEIENAKRSKMAVFDIARSNEWDWFITLTLSPQYVDRWDYQACYGLLRKWCDILRHKNIQYLIIPEEHPSSGAWHFHGLLRGNLRCVPSIVDGIYNITDWHYGFTTASRIRDNARSANYITKYISKNMEVPKGCHRYLASRSLARPDVEFSYIDFASKARLLMDSSFSKSICTQYGDFLLVEVGKDKKLLTNTIYFDMMVMGSGSFPEIEQNNDFVTVCSLFDAYSRRGYANKKMGY